MKYDLVLEDLRGKLSDIEDILLYEINNIENNRERQNNDKFTKTLENIKLSYGFVNLEKIKLLQTLDKHSQLVSTLLLRVAEQVLLV